MNEKPEDYLKNSEFLAAEALNLIIAQGAEQLYERYISTKCVPYSVDFLVSAFASVFELRSIRHEPSGFEVWEEDSEPRASPIDNWARNTVPVITKVKLPKSEPATTFAPDTKSVKSYSSRRSMARLPKSSSIKAKVNETVSIEEGILPVPIPQDKTEVNEEEEFLRQRKEREMKKRKEDSERLKKMKDEEADREKKLQKEAEDMKKKVFTYDHRGKIIYVNPVKCESLPENFAECRFISQEPPVEEKKPKSRKKSTNDFSAVKRVKTAPAHEREWVKNVTSIQPSLIEAISLNHNVTFIEGNRTKYPPVEKAEDGRTMTRKEYLMNYQSKQEAHVVIDKNEKNEKKSSSISSIDSARKGMDSKKDIFEIIPDYEDIPADRPDPSRGNRSVPPARSMTHGRIVQYGSGAKLDSSMGPMDKFNSEIMNNRNWGVNPPLKEPTIIDRRPLKPDIKQLRDVYGNILKKPKDVPFISANELWSENEKKLKKPRDRPFIERIEKKTRMPPPPYGFTMINALPELNPLAASGVSNKSLNRSENNK
jgi:PAS domain-containing protein